MANMDINDITRYMKNIKLFDVITLNELLNISVSKYDEEFFNILKTEFGLMKSVRIRTTFDLDFTTMHKSNMVIMTESDKQYSTLSSLSHIIIGMHVMNYGIDKGLFIKYESLVLALHGLYDKLKKYGIKFKNIIHCESAVFMEGYRESFSRRVEEEYIPTLMNVFLKTDVEFTKDIYMLIPYHGDNHKIQNGKYVFIANAVSFVMPNIKIIMVALLLIRFSAMRLDTVDKKILVEIFNNPKLSDMLGEDDRFNLQFLIL